MTVSSTIIKTSPYTGDGATVTFAFTWKVWAESEIKVILRLVSDGSETTLTLTTDYSVTLSADLPSAGSITTVATYSNLYTITIKANFPQTQEVDYGEGDKFPAESHEEALDRAVRLIQQLSEQLSRTLLLPESTSFEDLTLPDPEADKHLGWNAGATDLENKTVATTLGSGTIINVTAAYTLTIDNQMVFCTGTFIITLLAASTGFLERICNKGTGVITIKPGAGDTIEGSGSVILAAQYDTVTLKGDGVNTWIEV